MNNVNAENNDFITISEINGNPIVGSSMMLKSDFTASAKHISAFAQALKSINIKEKGVVEVKEMYGDVYGMVDNVEVVKFTHHPSIGWMVASSTALPSDISRAKAYVKAMVDARALVVKKKEAKKPVPKRNIFVNDYSESAFGGMRKVIEGTIDNKVVYTAKCFEEKWEFNLVGGLNNDFDWMVAFEEVVSEVNKQVRKQIK